MAITATALRQNLCRLLDEVLDTGIPLEVERKGRILRVEAIDAPSKLDRLEPHDCIVGDPDSLLNLNWSTLWSESPTAKIQGAPHRNRGGTE